jgi:hypothetical protein
MTDPFETRRIALTALLDVIHSAYVEARDNSDKDAQFVLAHIEAKTSDALAELRAPIVNAPPEIQHVRMVIVDREQDHIVLSSNGPARFEVSLIERQRAIIVHGYTGIEPDMTQDPIVVYDGTERSEMQNQIRVVGRDGQPL